MIASFQAFQALPKPESPRHPLQASPDGGACPPCALSSAAVTEEAPPRSLAGPQSILLGYRARVPENHREVERVRNRFCASLFLLTPSALCCVPGEWAAFPMLVRDSVPFLRGPPRWPLRQQTGVGGGASHATPLLHPAPAHQAFPQTPCSYSLLTLHSKMGSFLLHLSMWRKKALLL